MTREGYGRYYEHYYHEDRLRIKGRDQTVDRDRSFEYGRKFGRALTQRLRTYFLPGLTIDVGSSTGGILAGIKSLVAGIEPQDVEPTPGDAEYANNKGIPTTTALFEDYVEASPLEGKASTVLCVQSLNHLLDPMGFMIWAHRALKDGGHIILAVKNWRHQVRRAGRIEAAVQIDHPYMFTSETLEAMVRHAGFEVVYSDVDEHKSAKELDRQKKDGLHKHHIRIVGRKPARTLPDFDPKKVWRYWRLRLNLAKPVIFARRLIKL
jgi:SAM-dependent methyltransferase